ncbi:GNAT family N-acetyltransferase [Planctomicrobium sp. SH527]|uniref:GNAT family N-acetyltransferase n=1 Tax=Planctomicrobium sp. SH527 TaxID=3448123 RepID=UPI003F5B42C1
MALAQLELKPSESTTQHGDASRITIALGGDTSFSVQHLTSVGELTPYLEEWTQLSESSLEPNAYYAPWFFQSAAAHLCQNEHWHIVLVWKSDKAKPGSQRLCGFFPFVETRGFIRTRQWTLWQHPYCFLTTPLVEPGLQTAVFHCVLKFATDAKVHAVEFPLFSGEGALHQGMVECLRERLATTFIKDHYLRAITPYVTETDETAILGIGGHHLRELKRQRRKLESLGQLEYRVLRDTRTTDLWLDWFLKLESAGWKAQQGTALQQAEADTRFFRSMIMTGLAENKIKLEGLFLNGDPIAMKVNLFSPPAAFAFKIAFDETLRKWSPGIQLELESLQQFLKSDEINWADSCAAPGHPMIDRVWRDRRVIQHLLISTGHGRSDEIIGSLPLLRALRRTQRRLIQFIKSKKPKRGTQSPVQSTTQTSTQTKITDSNPA